MIIAVIIILSVLLILAFSGMYFVYFALYKKDGFNPGIVPEKEKENRDGKRITERNRESFSAFTERFMNGHQAEILETETDDGLTLKAELHRNDSHRYAILIHGYMGDRTQMRDIAAVYFQWGFSTLLPDNRAHGESDGKWIGMGWLDKDDILLWIRRIVAEDRNAEIVLHGVSMGGAAVMMASGLSLPDNVKAIAEDCGYTSVWAIFRDELKALYHLPSFPLLHSFALFSKLFAGYSPKEASSIKALKASSIPILFIHGDSDHFVGTYMLELNYSAKQGEKEKLLIHDAGHAEAYLREPELYFSTLKAFLSNFMRI